MSIDKATLAVAILAVVALASILVAPVGPEIKALSANFLTLVCSTAAVVMCLRMATALPKGGALRAVWYMLGLGCLSWTLAQGGYTGYLLLNDGAEPPYPSVADIGFVAAAAFIAIGLLRYRNHIQLQETLWGSLLAILVFLSAFALTAVINWPGLVSPVFTEAVVSLAYTVSDPVLIGVSILTASGFSGSTTAKAWWLVTLGAALFVAANLGYGWAQYSGGYSSGGLTDIGWSLAFVLIGSGALFNLNLLRETA